MGLRSLEFRVQGSRFRADGVLFLKARPPTGESTREAFVHCHAFGFVDLGAAV